MRRSMDRVAEDLRTNDICRVVAALLLCLLFCLLLLSMCVRGRWLRVTSAVSAEAAAAHEACCRASFRVARTVAQKRPESAPQHLHMLDDDTARETHHNLGQRRVVPVDELKKLERRHDTLQKEHDRLKLTIRRRVHDRLVQQNTMAANTKAFAETSMGTIAGWITAQTFFHVILELIASASVDQKWKNIIARSTYAVFASIVVPLIDWLLRPKTTKEQTHFIADQVRLIQRCLPLFYAWAWKDVVSAVLAVSEESFWPELVLTGIITIILVGVQMTPFYARAVRAVNQGGPDDTPAARMMVNLGNLGLAVGFAWNSVASWAPKEAMKHVQAPLFVFIIQCMYYFVITALIIFINARWIKAQAVVEKEEAREAREVKEASAPDGEATSAKREVPARPSGAEEEIDTRAVMAEMISDIVSDAGDIVQVNVDDVREGRTRSSQIDSDENSLKDSSTDLVVELVEEILEDLAEASRNVILSALHFVYAWAQLDTLNALFFTYLLGCKDAQSCAYRYNFFFALGVTIVFARVCAVLKLEKRRSEWNKASVALMTKAFSLNTGWAWSTYCLTAIKSAQNHEVVHPIWMYVICTAFAWICITALHRKFEVERRAWDRHCKEEAHAYELSLA